MLVCALVWARGCGGRTRGEGLLELVGLLGVLEDKGVKVALAADLELDGRGLLAALDASRAGVLAAADLDELSGMSVQLFLRNLFISTTVERWRDG